MISKVKKPVVFLTDFGLKDTYAGVLKGVVASISPETYMVDLSHNVFPQDVLEGSFLLATSFSYFPRGSVFCVVVDPGVGSDRKGICIETWDYYFVGPDNGVLWKAASRNKIRRIIHLTNTDYFLDPVSSTFHGRDIFAPVAAYISKGLEDLSLLGSPLEMCVEMEFPEIKETKDSLELSIIRIDRFGNLILNLEYKDFIRFIQDKKFCLSINNEKICKVFQSYAEAGNHELFLIVSSSCHMEVSAKNSNAAHKLNAVRLGRAVLQKLRFP